MRVFIVAGSPAAEPPAGLAPQPGDRVIVADSGVVHATAWGWPVYLLVGDLDSAPPTVVAALIAAGTPTLTAPTAKDETDLELALARALAGGATEIIFCAALGGRADHALANVLLLARPELLGIDARIVEGRQTIRLLRGGMAETPPPAPPLRREGSHTLPSLAGKGAGGLGTISAAHLTLAGAAGDLLSLLPIGGDAVGVTTAGLVYPLHDETLSFGQARGVSNIFEGKEAEVWLREGMLLVIHTTNDR